MRWWDTELHSLREVAGEADRIVDSWTPVDNQLSRLIGPSPGALGITVYVSVANVSTGARKGKAKSMFPLISSTEGWSEIEAEAGT